MGNNQSSYSGGGWGGGGPPSPKRARHSSPPSRTTQSQPRTEKSWEEIKADVCRSTFAPNRALGDLSRLCDPIAPFSTTVPPSQCYIRSADPVHSPTYSMCYNGPTLSSSLVQLEKSSGGGSTFTASKAAPPVIPALCLLQSDKSGGDFTFAASKASPPVKPTFWPVQSDKKVRSDEWGTVKDHMMSGNKFKKGDLVEFKEAGYKHWGMVMSVDEKSTEIFHVTEKITTPTQIAGIVGAAAAGALAFSAGGPATAVAGAVVGVASVVEVTLSSTTKAVCKKSELAEVAANHQIRVNNYLDKDVPPRNIEESLRLAESMVGEEVEYNIVSNNCEHHATYLRNGVRVSKQPENLYQNDPELYKKFLAEQKERFNKKEEERLRISKEK